MLRCGDPYFFLLVPLVLTWRTHLRAISILLGGEKRLPHTAAERIAEEFGR